MWRIAIDVALDAESASAQEGRRDFYRNVLDNLHSADALMPEMDGDLADVVTISIGIDGGEDFADTICRAVGAIRAAVHGAGGSTPDWPPCDHIDATLDESGMYRVEFKSQSADRVSA